MKSNYLLQLLIVISGVLLFSSCKTETETSTSYLIGIDSIKVPEVITSKVPFEVRVFGTVGPDGCYYFENIYNYPFSDDLMVIEAWGRFYYKGKACTGSVVYLDETVDLTIPEPGVYTLRTMKADGRYLDKVITVN